MLVLHDPVLSPEKLYLTFMRSPPCMGGPVTTFIEAPTDNAWGIHPCSMCFFSMVGIISVVNFALKVGVALYSCSTGEAMEVTLMHGLKNRIKSFFAFLFPKEGTRRHTSKHHLHLHGRDSSLREKKRSSDGSNEIRRRPLSVRVSEPRKSCEVDRVPIDGHFVVPKPPRPNRDTTRTAYPTSSETDSEIHPPPPKQLTLKDAAEIGIL